MTLIQTLPAELFDPILKVYVDTVPLHESFRARIVSRTFRNAIDHVLLAQTPAIVYETYLRNIEPEVDDRHDNGPPTFLRKNSHTLHMNHCMRNRGMNRDLTKCLNKLTDEMMQFANPTNDVIDTTVRKAYLSDICLTYSVLRPGMEILRDGSDKYSSKPDFLPPDTMDNDRRKDLKHSATPITSVDLLTAAAAVGNIEAVDHFIAQGADPLGYTSGILTGPIKAAAVCGHTPMVLKLVELARHDFPTLGARERDWILVTFETAVCHAMKAGDTESVRMLLEFFVTRREARIPEIWKKLITDGAQNGKTETLVTILKDDIPKRTPADHHSDLQYALKEACEAGHSELVCRILGGDFVLFNRDHLIQQTALEAARYGHRSLVDLLRSRGAHIGSQHLVEGMTTFADRATTHFLMTRHLVDAGVSIDAQVLKQCESKASFALRARHKMKQSHFCLTDGAMVTILIASEAKRQGLRAELKSCGSIKLLLRLVLNGKIIVPPEPLDFMKLAVEVVDWLANESQPAAS